MTTPRKVAEATSTSPTTAAGRALYLSEWNPGVFGEGDEGDPFLQDILAIEAEAAAPLRDALRGLVEALDTTAHEITERYPGGQFQSVGVFLGDIHTELDAARRALDEVDHE